MMQHDPLYSPDLYSKLYLPIHSEIKKLELAKEARRRLKEERQRKKEKKRNKKARIEKECISERMNCFR